MRKYRITKYDPALRNEDGWYMPDDWIDWSDIGKTYNGNMLDAREYKEVETKSIEVATKILKYKTVTTMEIKGLEDYLEEEDVSMYISIFKDKQIELSRTDEELWMEIRNGKRIINIENIPNMLRLLLRSLLWCRLVSKRRMKLYTGYDFYMYCECDSIPDEIINFGKREGIFVERMENDRWIIC